MKDIEELKQLKKELEDKYKLPIPVPSRLQILWATLKDYLLSLFKRR